MEVRTCSPKPLHNNIKEESSYLNIFVFWCPQADPVLFVHISGLKLSQRFPSDSVDVVVSSGVKLDLNVVFVDLIAKQHDLLAAGHRRAALGHSADGQVRPAL